MYNSETIEVPASRPIRRSNTIKVPDNTKLVPMTPYVKPTIDNFINEISELRGDVLTECIKNNNTHFTGTVVRWGDLKFYPKNYNGGLEEYNIQNSKSNRNPSVHIKSKKLPKKLEYGIRIMGGNASFNSLPVGILNDSTALQAEDRGHQGMVLFFYYDKQWPVSVWKSALRILSNNLTVDERTSDTTKIVESLKSLLNDKKVKKLSFSEIVPLEIKKKKDNTYIPIELKVYPNRTYHRREILGINNNEDTWLTHQKVAETEIDVEGIYGVDNDYFDKIYTPVEGTELFQGSKTMFSKHAKVGHQMERYEEEPIMLWLSSRQYRKGSLETYRGFDCSTISARNTQYKKFVENVLKDKLDTLVETEVNFLTYISECVNIDSFETKLNDVVKSYKGKSTTNIKDLSMTKVDSALMMAQIVRDYIQTHTSRLTRDVVITVGNQILKMATQLIDKTVTQKSLIEVGTGAKGRYQQFYIDLENELSTLPYEEVSDVKETLISNAKQSLHSSLNPNGEIPMIDRDENAKSIFKISIVNIDKGNGFESGHRKAGIEGKNIDNYFLQFEGDNGFWSNKRDFEPNDYSDEYLKSIKEFMKTNDLNENDDWQDAYQNTRKFVSSVWKH